MDAGENLTLGVDVSDAGTGRAARRWTGAAVQGHARHAVQVHQEREERQRRLRDRRMITRFGTWLRGVAGGEGQVAEPPNHMAMIAA